VKNVLKNPNKLQKTKYICNNYMLRTWCRHFDKMKCRLP